MPTTTPRALRDAFGRFATGVAVVTTASPSGEPIGLTINSFSSVSMEPPLVLWSLMKRSTAVAAFVEARRFAVHILGAEQEELSRRFASRTEDRFSGVGWAPGAEAVPLLADCLARFECRSHHTVDGGDHVVFLGQVERFQHRDGLPLLYFASRYAALHPDAALVGAAA